jgi:hypothetical protein
MVLRLDSRETWGAEAMQGEVRVAGGRGRDLDGRRGRAKPLYRLYPRLARAAVAVRTSATYPQ